MNEATEGTASGGAVDTTPNGASPTPEGTNGSTSSVSTSSDVAAPSLVRDAIALIKKHPLGAVATVAAATALLEIELAVGILAGLGASALLTNESGPATRKRVLEGGKQALARARSAMHSKPKAAPPPEVPPPV